MGNEERFVVGALRVVLAIHGNESLKGKRAVLNRIKARVLDRFNVSVAEVGSQDIHDTAVLGIAIVSNSDGYVHKTLEKVVRFIEGIGEAEVVADEVDIANYGGGFVV
jgi:uncharacterized protein YlxP (DUF503 family)